MDGRVEDLDRPSSIWYGGACMQPPFTIATVANIARELGIGVRVEPGWGYVLQLTYANGARRYFSNAACDLNPHAAAAIAKDKGYAEGFLRALGYPVPGSEVFFAVRWARAIGSDRTPLAARAYAERVGYPLFVKPNDLQQGIGVHCVGTAEAFADSVERITRRDRVFLVQRPIPGRDVRCVVLDGKLIVAYERTPLAVTGDGRSTIARLLRRQLRALRVAGRDVRMTTRDSRMRNRLARMGMTTTTVPQDGERVALLDSANCSTGGEMTDVTDALHSSYANLAASAARDLGLRFTGVDLLVDGDIRAAGAPVVILEMNAAPGLEHYASLGADALARVERMYREVLVAMGEDHTSASFLTWSDVHGTVPSVRSPSRSMR